MRQKNPERRSGFFYAKRFVFLWLSERGVAVGAPSARTCGYIVGYKGGVARIATAH